MHDVVEVREEVCVGGHVLAPLHDPTDQLVGVELPLLVALRQHGRLGAARTTRASYTITWPISIVHFKCTLPTTKVWSHLEMPLFKEKHCFSLNKDNINQKYSLDNVNVVNYYSSCKWLIFNSISM